jgi:adhesin transport system outer membrane protein
MTRFRTSFLACTGLLTLFVGVAPVNVRAETLGKAVEAALNQHPSIAAARANRDAYGEEQDESYAGYFPTLSASLQAGRMYGDNSTSRGLNTTRGVGYSWLGDGTVAVSQMLFDGFETSRRVDASGARIDSAMQNIIDVREDLALKTVLAYLDVLRTKESADKIRAHHVKLADYRMRIQKMVEEGAADKSMESQARDIQIQLEATLADLDGQHRAAIAQYQEMTGTAPSEPMALPEVKPGMEPAALPAAVTYALEHNAGLKSRMLMGDGLAMDARAEQSALYPDVTGDLSYMKSDKEDVLGGEAVDARAVVKMNWRFSTGGAELSRIRKAKYRAEEGRAQAEDMRRQIEREVTVAWSEIDKARAQMELQKEREAVSAELFTNYQSQFEGARINLLQLLQSDNNHFNAQLARMNADYRLLASRYNLLASMGRLQEALDIVPSAVARADDE